MLSQSYSQVPRINERRKGQPSIALTNNPSGTPNDVDRVFAAITELRSAAHDPNPKIALFATAFFAELGKSAPRMVDDIRRHRAGQARVQ